MGTTEEKLAYLAETKELIAAALEAQGASVSEIDTFRSYAEKILTIGKLPDITKEDEGKILRVIDGMWAIGSDISIDESFSNKGNAADAKATGDRFKLIEKNIADLLYQAISITSFTNNVNTVEIGSIVQSVTLSWKFSKTPASVTLDGEEQAVDSTGAALTGLALTANKTWTLKATDERDAAASKSTSLSFVNGVYYGVAAEPAAIDSALIRGLTRNLRGNKLSSFTVNAGEGQYIFYCLPTRYGACTFTVGGFTGGFTLAGTVSFTNASSYTEKYYVYRSDHAGLGGTTVNVS